MLKLARECNELIELAKRTKDESVFQQKHHYKKFKAKTKAQDYDTLGELVTGLCDIGFYKECIWWCKRILDDNRLREKIARFYAFHLLLVSYNDLHDYENALDSGKKCLQVCSIMDDETARKTTKFAYDIMRNASVQLKRNQDALKYTKESLKVDVIRFNNKEIQRYEIFLSYHKLIQMHMTNCDYGDAHKMIEKRLTLFRLNSRNPDDVKTSLKNEGYGNVMCLNSFLNDNGDDIDEQNIFRFQFICEKLIFFFTEVQSFYYIAKICWQKHEINLYCDDLQTNLEWGHIAWNILNDILFHFRKFTLTTGQSYKYIDNCLRNLNESKGFLCGNLSVKNFFVDYISMTLLLADCDYSKRKKLFQYLGGILLFYLDAQLVIVEEREDLIQYSGLEKNASFYILEALRTNEKLDAEKVMPFIDFCLKSVRGQKKLFLMPKLLDFAGNFHGENGLKVQMIKLKNSLAIVNHMKKINVNKTEESQ